MAGPSAVEPAGETQLLLGKWLSSCLASSSSFSSSSCNLCVFLTDRIEKKKTILVFQ